MIGRACGKLWQKLKIVIWLVKPSSEQSSRRSEKQGILASIERWTPIGLFQKIPTLVQFEPLDEAEIIMPQIPPAAKLRETV